MLNLYNTLTRKIEPISPEDGKIIRMYTCGPTVYNFAHVGNLRSYIMADLLYRTLKFDGYNVEYAMNITDVDDKTIASTIAEFGEDASVADLDTFTTRYLNAFLKDLEAVNIDSSKIKIIRVSDVIPQIQDFILLLLEKGFAYQTNDGVFFSIEKYQEKFGDYGALVGEKFLEGKKIGARVAVDEYEKEDLSDFALWKAHTDTDRNIFWNHPSLGKGRPGWHIECSVINKVAFGENAIDIHTGGVDLIFPHHTNEIAQSQPLGPFVKHWMHAEHLQVENDKMAKSKKNFYTLRDVEEKGFTGLDLRYLYLQSNYRTQQNFSWESLEASKAALQKLKSAAIAAESGSAGENSTDAFASALDNDLNTAQALATVWEQKNNFAKYDEVLGLKLTEQAAEISVPTEVQTLLDARQTARDSKDFTKSDELRDQIAKLGFEVKDTSNGQQIRKV
ncbi:MAG TPA: cysteine--tRNA ligase [Patescibacteria group bacterium]|jgi:cysteinyl-tRNA synthetase|nr:cysteine--tRNA ligase [Patescibacteria group bacterium]